MDRLSEREETPRRALTASLPNEALRLAQFSIHLADWVGSASHRLLLLRSWETYPINQTMLFEKVRAGCGEERHLIKAPGHLFEPSGGGENDEEDALLSGFVFLVMGFNWEAYLVAGDGGDHVLLGDEYVAFSITREAKIEEAGRLAKSFDLAIR